MLIIAGSAKGRKLVAPTGPGTRPALAQVKEAIFNILGDIAECEVLDLFAGSGAIGLEALSRGAGHCVFVDKSRAALMALDKNIESCDFRDRSEIVPLPVSQVLQHLKAKGRHFDLIFVDPPYDENLVMSTLEGLEKVLADAGIVIVENSPREPVSDMKGLKVSDVRQYGQTEITFLEAKL